MRDSIKLLDKYAKMCGHASDSATARALKVQPSAVNNWRHERASPDAESVERMCEATGEPLARWLPLIEAERARSPGARRAWLRLAQVAAVVSLTVSFQPVHAAPVSLGHNTGHVYIMSNYLRWLRKAGTRLAGLLAHLTHGGSRVPTPHPFALAV